MPFTGDINEGRLWMTVLVASILGIIGIFVKMRNIKK